jgi:PAS domain S-box-containing protein
MLTSVVVLLVTAAAFTVYDLVSYRRIMVRNLADTAAILAGESAPALAARDQREALHILGALRADPDIQSAALYDVHDRPFLEYTAPGSADRFPTVPSRSGYHWSRGRLFLFEPVLEGNTRIGTLYLNSEVRPLYVRLRLYGGIALLVLCGAVFLAMVLANLLQQRISGPILALAKTAGEISKDRDFSIRAPKPGGDELGLLTDAFNQMLARIQHDVTERKQAERELHESRARLSGIIGSAMDAIISVDASQRVTIFNAAAERMFGCAAAEAMGQPLDRFLPERFREGHRRHVEEFGRSGVTSRAMGHLRPLAALRISGEEFPVEASISQVEVAGQEVYTVILRDITERRRAQEALERQAAALREQTELLQQAQAQLKGLNAELEQRVNERTLELTASNKEMEAFTYSVAHDLRAPLRHIDAFSKILLEDFSAVLPPEGRRYLENVRTGGHHMSQLVDDLLNLARVGRQELKREPTPLAHLVDEVVADLKHENEGRKIDWRIQPLPTIECDPGLMKLVFANLLSNAVKYTRPRPVASIEVGVLQSNVRNTAIFVRDNGVGFNMKYLDKLFGVFQRLHRAEEFEGTGVGLATVERIVRKHGGCVWAEGAVDKGAAFYFSLPGLQA